MKLTDKAIGPLVSRLQQGPRPRGILIPATKELLHKKEEKRERRAAWGRRAEFKREGFSFLWLGLRGSQIAFQRRRRDTQTNTQKKRKLGQPKRKKKQKRTKEDTLAMAHER